MVDQLPIILINSLINSNANFVATCETDSSRVF
jgi:hypothetical protein